MYASAPLILNWMELSPMNLSDDPYFANFSNDNDLWCLIAERVKQLPPEQRGDWQSILESLRERDLMTLQALQIAESGLEMILNQRRSASQPIGPAALGRADSTRPETNWRVDPHPGSGGCMWLI
jgi:hypothetical protein